MNLIEGLQEKMNRSRELLKCYEEIPTGGFGAMMIRQDIATTERAISNGDTIEMVQMCEVLDNHQ